MNIFEEFDSLLSAIKISDVKPYMKLRPNKNIYDSLFGNKDRIFMDIDISEEDVKEMFKVRRFVTRAFFFSKDIENFAYAYFKELGKDEEAEMAKKAVNKINNVSYYAYLGDKDTLDFIENYLLTGKYKCRTTNRSINVGKILKYVFDNKLYEKYFPNTQYDEKYVKEDITMFNQRFKPSKTGELVIVISRNPYDIAGQSTDRGWKSCMDIYEGQYKEYVGRGISHGVLIAYLCNKNDTTKIKTSDGILKNDKINIQKPLGRILIKPYTRDGKEMDFENPNWILRTSKSYGTFYQKAIEKVQKWLDENWNSKIDINDDLYEFDNENFYGEASGEDSSKFDSTKK